MGQWTYWPKLINLPAVLLHLSFSLTDPRGSGSGKLGLRTGFAGQPVHTIFWPRCCSPKERTRKRMADPRNYMGSLHRYSSKLREILRILIPGVAIEPPGIATLKFSSKSTTSNIIFIESRMFAETHYYVFPSSALFDISLLTFVAC